MLDELKLFFGLEACHDGAVAVDEEFGEVPLDILLAGCLAFESGIEG